jgi:hypothetical protein
MKDEPPRYFFEEGSGVFRETGSAGPCEFAELGGLPFTLVSPEFCPPRCPAPSPGGILPGSLLFARP